MSANAAYYDLEFRTYSVLWRTAKISSVVARNSTPLWWERFKAVVQLAQLVASAKDLVEMFHEDEIVANAIVEYARLDSQESLAEMCGRIDLSVERTKALVATLREVPLLSHGPFLSIYLGLLVHLEHHNSDLALHVEAFRDEHNIPIMISKKDQKLLVKSLLAPPDPNKRLQESFRRYTTKS